MCKYEYCQSDTRWATGDLGRKGLAESRSGNIAYAWERQTGEDQN